MATAGVLLFKVREGAGPRMERSEPQQGVGWRSIGKAVHTQGGADKRRYVATARVLLFKRGAGLAPASSEASRSRGWLVLFRQGGTHTRQCTHKAEHTKGGLWPPQ